MRLKNSGLSQNFCFGFLHGRDIFVSLPDDNSTTCASRYAAARVEQLDAEYFGAL
jgi:hypothetical protein